MREDVDAFHERIRTRKRTDDVVDGIAPGLFEQRTPSWILTDAFTHQMSNGCGHLADLSVALG
jgi:hypothetical protein